MIVLLLAGCKCGENEVSKTNSSENDPASGPKSEIGSGKLKQLPIIILIQYRNLQPMILMILH
ncbi:hypothetical protein PJ311_14970 [Bacillus sp. CLL-7-23]|uniref:Lipoprotein n=1 Tax=Bacillus changyiensis TaxID=3004103 RepID=A0ABT4X947_9BACI|nr:hypothetical protein [Bacillus changyiensis]MDA7027877.1 hypothetical protein [Bacillus changyiensis]